jgi:hypothetical protein
MGEHGENRSAVHDRRFEKEFTATGTGEFAQLAVSVHDGTFIGADGMRAGFQSGLNVADGRLAAAALERAGFEKHVGVRSREPFADICWPHDVVTQGPMMSERGRGVEAVGIGNPTDAARSNAGKLPRDFIILLKRQLFCGEQADEFPSNISEADKREPIGVDKALLAQSFATHAAALR